MKSNHIRIAALMLALFLTLSVGVTAAPAELFEFSDVSDAALALQLSELYTLGVIQGVGGGRFQPEGTLTRAQFCKMAIIVMNHGALESQYRSRTIFTDVPATHWARGYINLAAAGEDRIISGLGNGCFSPDTSITYAQAITILVRLLGYTDEDAGSRWPEGYLGLAKKVKLSDLELAAGSVLTRAQAVPLFCSLLRANEKTGLQYVARFGSLQRGIILTNLDTTFADGSPAIGTSAGLFQSGATFPALLLSQKGTLVTDQNNQAILFMPNQDTATSKITANTIEAAWVRDAAGVKHQIPGTTTVYTADETVTWSEKWLSLRAGTALTLYYSERGIVTAAYIWSSVANDVMVAKNEVSGNPFAALVAGKTDFTILKNGAPAALSDIRRYDVAEYDNVSNTLLVTDFKITGYYENAFPSQASPESLTVMGRKFTVLPAAQDDLAAFKIGGQLTLLLTDDCRIAGVVPTSAASGNAVGVVTAWSEERAEISLLGGIDASTGKPLVLSGNPGSRTNTQGELVIVSSYRSGYLSLSTLGGYSASEQLDLERKTVGGKPLSPAVKLYDRVNRSAVTEVSLDELTKASVTNARISYMHTDYAGRVDIIVFDDATGDSYTYGFFEVDVITDYSMFGPSSNRTVAVKNSDGTTIPVKSGAPAVDKAPGGIALSADGQSVANLISLTKVTGVRRSAFYEENERYYVSLSNMVLPVSDKVQCYNQAAEIWFSSVDEIRAFAQTMTVYYDRAPELGGKIRLLVSE